MTFKRSFGKWLFPLVLLITFPQTAQSADQETAKAWNVRCDKDNEKCEVFHRYIIKETGQRIIEFAIGQHDTDQTAMGVVILPLGIKVNQPIQIQMDGKPYEEFNIESCSQNGCFSSIPIHSDFINSLQASSKISFIFVNLENQAITVEMTTKGFIDAFLKALQNTKPSKP